MTQAKPAPLHDLERSLDALNHTEPRNLSEQARETLRRELAGLGARVRVQMGEGDNPLCRHDATPDEVRPGIDREIARVEGVYPLAWDDVPAGNLTRVVWSDGHVSRFCMPPRAWPRFGEFVAFGELRSALQSSHRGKDDPLRGLDLSFSDVNETIPYLNTHLDAKRWAELVEWGDGLTPLFGHLSGAEWALTLCGVRTLASSDTRIAPHMLRFVMTCFDEDHDASSWTNDPLAESVHVVRDNLFAVHDWRAHVLALPSGRAHRAQRALLEARGAHLELDEDVRGAWQRVLSDLDAERKRGVAMERMLHVLDMLTRGHFKQAMEHIVTYRADKLNPVDEGVDVHFKAALRRELEVRFLEVLFEACHSSRAR